MPFMVRRRNRGRRVDVDDPRPNVANRRQAFDRAWDACGDYIKQAIRKNRGVWGDADEPGDSDVKFKVYVELRPGKQRGVKLRYDYPTGTPPNNPEGTWETNDIEWLIVEVP